jgi:catechol 2,3-dioxygenase-like lactoylglutathione lyase family enzyme
MDAVAIDGVRLGVTDLDAAVADYTRLLGVAPAVGPGGARRFQLARGAVEVETGPPGLRHLALRVTGGAGVPPAVHGVRVHVVAEPAPPAPPGAVAAIDHVVVHTTAPERAIAAWRDRAGLRLALDRVFEGRGLRLLFFRAGGITLEYASPHPAPADAGGDDVFYGLSYRVADVAAWRERLVAAGVDVSPVRTGMRPGTSVVTVRSGTAGVPTLLLQVHTPA